MKNLKGIAVLSLLAPLLLACGCASMGIMTEGERVRAEGAAPYNPSDPDGSRRAAILAAQRNAVEQVLGVFISAQTRVSKAELIDSKIMSASAGFLKSYAVTGEKQDGQIYRVSIKAVVLLNRVDKELGALRLDESAPLAAVSVSCSGEGEVRDAARAVEQELSKAGFKLLAQTEQSGFAKALPLARASGADYLVMVDGNAYKADGAGLGDGFYAYRARVAAKAVAVDDGSTVSDSAREAGGLDVAEAVAARKAMASAAELAAKDVAPALEMAARSRTKTARIYISGLSGLDQLRDFRKSVSGLPTVDECRLDSYESGDAVFMLRLQAAAGDDFAAAIMRVSPFALALTSVTPYEIRLKAN